jgi:hypothetical protein
MRTSYVHRTRKEARRMCWSRYEDRWAIEEERERAEEMRRLLAEVEEPARPRADVDETERELVEA